MNKYLKAFLIGLLALTLVSTAGVGIAAAEEDPPRPHEVLAELLGLTAEELWEEIQGGTTLEELADEAGIDLEAFWQEMSATREADHKARLQDALENGDITQEQYNWMMEGIQNGYMGGGMGPGRIGGRGQFGAPGGEKPVDGWGGFGRGSRPFGGCGMWGNEG